MEKLSHIIENELYRCYKRNIGQFRIYRNSYTVGNEFKIIYSFYDKKFVNQLYEHLLKEIISALEKTNNHIDDVNLFIRYNNIVIYSNKIRYKNEYIFTNTFNRNLYIAESILEDIFQHIATLIENSYLRVFCKGGFRKYKKEDFVTDAFMALQDWEEMLEQAYDTWDVDEIKRITRIVSEIMLLSKGWHWGMTLLTAEIL